MEGYQEIGKLGKPHGTKGALKVDVDAAYEADVTRATALFVSEQGRPFPYFVAGWQNQHTIVLLEDVNSLEAAKKLSHQPLFLPVTAITVSVEEEADDLDAWLAYQIEDTEQGLLGEITEIIDLPEQLIAVINYQDREVLIPLHEDLITEVDPDQKIVFMDLPTGILSLD